MKRALALVPLLVVLTGCTASPQVSAPSVEEAHGNCLSAYEELPHAIEVLTEQSGEQADASTPCDNWLESQGEEAFVDFWTTPSTFIPYVISQGKLEGVSAVG